MKPKKKKPRKIKESPDFWLDSELCEVYQNLCALEENNKSDNLLLRKCFCVRLFLAGGFRPSELCRVQRGDIRLKEKPPVIMVRNGKGGKDRAVQVIPEFEERLRAWIKNLDPEDYLFPNPNGGHVNRERVYRYWREVIDLIGARRIPPKDARHTFATWESERVAMPKLQRTMGHSDIATTAQYYLGNIVGRNYSELDEPPKWREEAR